MSILYNTSYGVFPLARYLFPFPGTTHQPNIAFLCLLTGAAPLPLTDFPIILITHVSLFLVVPFLVFLVFLTLDLAIQNLSESGFKLRFLNKHDYQCKLCLTLNRISRSPKNGNATQDSPAKLTHAFGCCLEMHKGDMKKNSKSVQPGSRVGFQPWFNLNSVDQSRYDWF